MAADCLKLTRGDYCLQVTRVLACQKPALAMSVAARWQTSSCPASCGFDVRLCELRREPFKWGDGMIKTDLTATDYRQMAGRAGRAGIDDAGITCYDSKVFSKFY